MRSGRPERSSDVGQILPSNANGFSYPNISSQRPSVRMTFRRSVCRSSRTFAARTKDHPRGLYLGGSFVDDAVWIKGTRLREAREAAHLATCPGSSGTSGTGCLSPPWRPSAGAWGSCWGTISTRKCGPGPLEGPRSISFRSGGSPRPSACCACGTPWSPPRIRSRNCRRKSSAHGRGRDAGNRRARMSCTTWVCRQGSAGRQGRRSGPGSWKRNCMITRATATGPSPCSETPLRKPIAPEQQSISCAPAPRGRATT